MTTHDEVLKFVMARIDEFTASIREVEVCMTFDKERLEAHAKAGNDRRYAAELRRRRILAYAEEIKSGDRQLTFEQYLAVARWLEEKDPEK